MKCVKTHSYNFEQALPPPHLFLFHTAKQRGSSALNQITESPGTLTQKTTSGKERRKKGMWLWIQLSLRLPSSVNPFHLSWAVSSCYYSNYPKQKNSCGEKKTRCLMVSYKPNTEHLRHIHQRDLSSAHSASQNQFWGVD